ncbi:GntP family permease [Enterocloster sp. OA13]|uniref:GntP family permease n=1 Tax=Enterocloster sp. OA13 TaxID=2914161 RepID=UPI000471C7B2|nr:GntP family permease [Enterocloster sp. OA13]
MGVLLAFTLLVILMYKKVPIIVAAPVCAVVMAALSGLNIMSALTGDYMEAMVGFIKSYFILFLICAIFGRIMDVSGAAYSIGKWLGAKLGARYAMWGVSVAALVLTYGGVSCFVLVFAIYPIALVLFKEADISRKLIPGTIIAGMSTAPNILWGSPGLCNVIPTTYLGTTVKAAPLVSVICSIFFYLSAMAYLIFENRKMQKRGERFIPTEKIEKLLADNAAKKAINPGLALVPIAVIIITLNGFNLDVNIAMLCGVIAGYILFWGNITDKMDTMVVGAQNAIGSIMNTSTAVGIGGVAKITAAFGSLMQWVSSLGGSPLVSWAAAVTMIAGACGSGSGGVALACSTLADKYLAMGVNPEILHRIASCACIVLDSLPWNGVMITVMQACDLTHKEAYKHLFMITVVLAFFNLLLCVGLGLIMY